MKEHRHIAFNKARLKARQAKKARNRETKRRSGKKNNYRKPPAPRQKKAATCSEESQRIKLPGLQMSGIHWIILVMLMKMVGSVG